jgi:putative endonuclease
MNRRKIGSDWEKRACAYLMEQGYFILTTNYNCPFGEIDIIASQHKTIIFIEVKYRSDDSCGYAAEAVTQHKQNSIKKTAMYYLTEKIHSFDVDCRFDVVCIDGEEVSHIQNAFQ